MAADSLRPEIRQFLAKTIASVEQLEVLCLFVEQPAKSWSIPALFQQVQSSEKSIASCLEKFRSAGLIDADAEGQYRLSLKNAANSETVSAVVKAYRDRRVSVIEFIYQKPGDPIQDFADAFRLRKEK